MYLTVGASPEIL